MMQSNLTINASGRLLSLDSPIVMGILNATPDSFWAGSRVQTEADIARRACQIVAEGAMIIDVGAHSTRPGGQYVSADEEMRRLRMALDVVRREVPQAVVSVDTFRPDVARMAVEEFGASIINDVSEGGLTGVVDQPLPDGVGRDAAMFATVARLGVAYVLMSVKPTIGAMCRAFADEVAQLRALGVRDIILDPGFGFGKSLDDNYAILAQLSLLREFGLPVLVGISRKSMATRLLDITPDQALNATTALNAAALAQGAHILRVHDVRQAVECVAIANKLRAAANAPII